MKDTLRHILVSVELLTAHNLPFTHKPITSRGDSSDQHWNRVHLSITISAALHMLMVNQSTSFPLLTTCSYDLGDNLIGSLTWPSWRNQLSLFFQQQGLRPISIPLDERPSAWNERDYRANWARVLWSCVLIDSLITSPIKCQNSITIQGLSYHVAASGKCPHSMCFIISDQHNWMLSRSQIAA